MFLGIGYYLKEQYEKSINVLKEGVSRKPDWVGNHIILAAAYAQASLSSEAAHEAQEILRLEPFFEIENYGTVFRNQADRAKIVQGLRKATPGLILAHRKPPVLTSSLIFDTSSNGSLALVSLIHN